MEEEFILIVYEVVPEETRIGILPATPENIALAKEVDGEFLGSGACEDDDDTIESINAIKELVDRNLLTYYTFEKPKIIKGVYTTGQIL